MLDNFIYENHLGQRFDGLKNKVYANYNELRDYSWSYDTINSRISRFYRPIRDRKIPLWVHCNSEAEAIAVRNRLYELTDADVEAKKPGKVYIGEYYTIGYITSSVKSEYLIHKKMCRIDLVLTSEDAAWYKETTLAFPRDTRGLGGNIDYPYDYEYDFSMQYHGKKIVCNSAGSNPFRLSILGEANNPTVSIGGHTYSVNCTLALGEALLIDSISKTITLTTETGNKVNCFDLRNRDSYIFEPIPPGETEIAWDGTFDFEITVLEKRSEPRWT